MTRIPHGQYTKEVREEAIRLVETEKLGLRETARRLSIPSGTLKNWVMAFRKGELQEVGKNQKPFTDLEMELARTKRELAEVGMERDLLKKFAAYFAKESR